MLRISLFIALLMFSAVGLFGQAKPRLTVKGEIVAIDRFASLGHTSSAEQNDTFIVKLLKKINDPPTYVLVEYIRWESGDDLVQKNIEKGGIWILRLNRKKSCDAKWADIEYLQVEGDKQDENKLSRFHWLGTGIASSEIDGRSLACYVLDPRHSQPLQNGAKALAYLFDKKISAREKNRIGKRINKMLFLIMQNDYKGAFGLLVAQPSVWTKSEFIEEMKIWKSKGTQAGYYQVNEFKPEIFFVKDDKRRHEVVSVYGCMKILINTGYKSYRGAVSLERRGTNDWYFSTLPAINPTEMNGGPIPCQQ